MNGVLQGNCRNTCNIPQKTPMEEFTKNNSLTRQMLFSERLHPAATSYNKRNICGSSIGILKFNR